MLMLVVMVVVMIVMMTMVVMMVMVTMTVLVVVMVVVMVDVLHRCQPVLTGVAVQLHFPVQRFLDPVLHHFF